MENLNKFKKSAEEFLNSDSGYATLTRVVLAVLLIAGTLTVAVMAPNIFSVMGKQKRLRRYTNRQIGAALYGLRRRNIIEFIKEEDGEITIKLNYKEKDKIKKFAFDILSIPKLKKWDGKWRAVIFDVPVQFNAARRAMMLKLKELGFYQLQKSVWVHPFPCEDEILFVASIFNIEKFINILVAEKILKEADLKKTFKL